MLSENVICLVSVF